MNLESEVIRRGGLAATHELYAAGATKWMLARATRTGRLLRVRQGWYCLPDAPDEAVRAFRVGGRLGCVAAARFHGMWVRGIPRTHVCVPTHDARLRSERDKSVRLRDEREHDTVVHWCPRTPGGTRFVESPLGCLITMARCQSLELVVAAADSAIRGGQLTRAQWSAATEHLPARMRRLLDEADGRAESITESVALFRLRRIGLRPRQQVTISGVGRVDLLIGRRLVIELDGREFHADRFEADRRRDALLSIRGYRVLRFTYRQVFERWAEVREAILASTARGDHR